MKAWSRPDRVAGDDDALDQRVRRRQHQRDVLAGAGLGLVGVDHQVVRLAVALRDEAPLHAGREARAAAAAQPGVLDAADDVVGVIAQRLRQRLVAVVAAVGLQRPGRRLVPEPAEHRGEQRRSASRVVVRSAPAASRSRRLRLGDRGAARRRAVSRRRRRAARRGSAPARAGRRRSVLIGGGSAALRRPSSARPQAVGRRARPRVLRRPASRACGQVRERRTRRAAGRRLLVAGPQPSTRSRAVSGVWLSKNSQLTITTGA